MVLKLDNVAEWESWADLSKTLVLHGEKRRRIRLELNCSDRCRVSLLKGPTRQEIVFLANIDGMETIDFIESGNVHIVVQPLVDHDDVQVFYYTADGQHTHEELPDRKVFTRMHTQRARNPELEYLQTKMMENVERRIAHINNDAELRHRETMRLLEAKEKELADAREAADKSPGSPAPASGSELSEPYGVAGDDDDGDAAKPAKPAKSGGSAGK